MPGPPLGSPPSPAPLPPLKAAGEKSSILSLVFPPGNSLLLGVLGLRRNGGDEEGDAALQP